ncbi:MAG: ADP-heptose synthase [Dehalococcoidia bacterium]|nr:ADP-heptose synthase [Dehalococcoidia bacterium]
MGRIVTPSEIVQAAMELRDIGRTIVFTNGCFDLLHLGHVRYLQQAKELGDVLVVGLNSDTSASAIKGADRPLVPEEARAEVLTALDCVDYVVIFSQPTARELVELLKPEVYVKGGDYSSVELLPEAPAVASYGGRVVLLPYVPGYSTTDLIDKIVRLHASS